MMKQPQLICIIIPIYNEERTIGSIVESLKDKGFDILVIDDGSKDHSGNIAKKKGAMVIRHEHNLGKGASIKQGFSYVVEHGYQGVVIMDGDGQHHVDDIDQFLDLAQKHEQVVVVGNRMANARGMPWIRYITNKCMSSVISWACRQTIPDTQCGYRFISVAALKLLQLECNDFEVETEILMKASKQGVPILSVPVRTIYDEEVSKINPLIDSIRFITYFIKEINSR